jgi:hypothetical protein
MENTIQQIEDVKTPELAEHFEEYKKSEEYKQYFAMIKNDKPNLSEYLINMILFGHFHEMFIEQLPEDQKCNYKSIMDEEPKLIPPVKGDMLGIKSYSSEEEYAKAHPNLRPMKTIGEPLQFVEHEVNENNIDIENYIL